MQERKGEVMDGLNKTKSNLKPCPFCGGEAKLHQAANWNAGCYETWVHCDECGATVSGRDVPLTYQAISEGIVSATAAWNRRKNYENAGGAE